MVRLSSGDGLLGTNGAARFLGISRSTIDFWRRKGDLMPTLTLDGPRGPRFRYSIDDLTNFQQRIEYSHEESQ